MRMLFGALSLVVASVVSTVQADDAAPPAVRIAIFNYKFDPATVTVPAGTTVTWTNHDDIPHTVASSNKSFKGSGGLDTGDSYSYTFDRPGTYKYYCTLHPFMTGTVVVMARGG